MSEIGFDGKVAIVTGAGGGLGRQHALLLASRGARVVINDLGGSVAGEGSDLGPAEKVAQEIRDAGGEAVSDGHSVSTAEGGAAIVQTAIDAYGQIDIVINNAGILRDKSFHNLTPELLEPVLDVHLKGAFYVSQPAWVKMRDQGYGRIVNTTSQSGVLGNFGQANYGAAKMGLVGLTRVLAIEGAKYNIRVNAIAPIARTRMTEDLMGPAAEKLDPEQVSPVVAWLASEDCSVTGEVFTVAAGRVGRFFVGMTQGYFNNHLTVEDVRDHLDEIRDEDGYLVPPNSSEETAFLFKMIQENGG